MSKRILIADDGPAVRKRLRVSIEQPSDWEICGEACNGMVSKGEAILRLTDALKKLLTAS